MQTKIKNIDILPDGLAILWSDNLESYILFSTLRDNCPCAFCSGESDIFGNVYKGEKKKYNESSYQLLRVIYVGQYGLQMVWGDKHKDGIYTYELLKKLNLV